MTDPTTPEVPAPMTPEEAAALWSTSMSVLGARTLTRFRMPWNISDRADANKAAVFLREMADALDDHGCFTRIDAYELRCFDGKGGGCGGPLRNEHDAVRFCRTKRHLADWAEPQWRVDIEANTATCPACIAKEEGKEEPDTECSRWMWPDNEFWKARNEQLARENMTRVLGAKKPAERTGLFSAVARYLRRHSDKKGHPSWLISP